MDKVIFFILVLYFFVCPGDANTREFTVNGTSHFSVTGTIRTSMNNMRDILDDESEAYKSIATNLTRGFGQFFLKKYDWLNYTVSVKELFIWPTNPEKNRNPHNLSFAIIAQNKFQTTPAHKGIAQDCLEIILREHLIDMEKDAEGFITSEGLRVKYEQANILPEKMLHNITLGYMAFITRLKNNHGGGGNGIVPTKTPTANSSEQESYNSSTKGTVFREPREISFRHFIAYIGITLSMIGLFITMTSICYFRRLRKFRRNQILAHICATIMAGMLLSIQSFSYKGDRRYCITLALLLHYFILAALSWMCVEAYNLYRDLVKVFNTNVVSYRTFTIRACIFGYGLPAVIVATTCFVDINAYGKRNDACWMTSIAFLVSFLAPVLCIVSINIIFFCLIMREIIQVSQRDANNITPSLRAAISLSVVLGFCWLLAGISTFTSNPFVTYAFVIMSSFQGLFIFLFHGIGKQELRDSWKSLAIFNWQFNRFTSMESQGRGKTESTTQDTPQVPKQYSKDVEGNKDFNSSFEAGVRSACDAGYNHGCSQEDSGLNGSDYNIPGVPEHKPFKKVEKRC